MSSDNENIFTREGRKILVYLIIFLLVMILVMIFSSSIGPVTIPPFHTLGIMLDFFKIDLGIDYLQRDQVVILDIRLPRVFVSSLVGAALGISGAIMQGLFRNPLVEPGYIGVSSGAAVAAVLVLYFGLTGISVWILPIAAFIGALGALFLILFIWKVSRKKSVSSLLLIGLGINLFLSAVISLLIASAPSEQELRSIVFWLQGGLEARTWDHVKLISPFILSAILVTTFFSRELNMMLLGDEQAKSSGVDVDKTRKILLVLSALMTGAGVSVSGTIGFVGLIVPHGIRLIFGPDHRLLLPTSALAGASFLTLADLVSRMLIHPVTIQVGVVSSLIGAPIFLLLVVKTKKGGI